MDAMAVRTPNQLALKNVTKSKRSESLEVMDQLRVDAKRIATHFKLRYRELRAERDGATGHYGICYDDGTIRIRLRHARSGKLLRYSSLVNTLCHELAHLKYFDHGDDFKRFYFAILAWAREQGIYRPERGQKPLLQSRALPCQPRELPSITRQLQLF